MTYDNTNKGILSKNDRKEKDTHPDYRGEIDVGGVKYWLNGWIKQRKDGTGSILSLSVQLKDTVGRPRDSNVTPTGIDDIPF